MDNIVVRRVNRRESFISLLLIVISTAALIWVTRAMTTGIATDPSWSGRIGILLLMLIRISATLYMSFAGVLTFCEAVTGRRVIYRPMYRIFGFNPNSGLDSRETEVVL